MATSVPVPMAMPTSAVARAGASLTPSPAIATLRPSAWSFVTAAAFWSGRTSATTSSMPSSRRHRLGGGAAVAGEHDQPQALGVERRDRRRGALLDRVGHPQQARQGAVDGDEDDRLPGGLERLGPPPQLPGLEPQLGEQRPVAQHHLAALDPPADTLAGARGEVARGGQLQAPVGGAGDDRLGQRVLAGPLEGGGQPEEVGLARAARRRGPAAAAGGLDRDQPRARPRSGCRSCPAPGCRPRAAARSPRRS